MNIDQLDTARLVLEPLSMQHSGGVSSIWSDPEVCRYSGEIRDYEGAAVPSPVASSADSDRIIDFWVRACADGWGCRWALRQRSSDAVVGMTGFNALGACAEYAYHLNRSYWGHGFMSEATVAALSWVADRGSTDAEAFIDPANVSSVRLAERNGFERTAQESEGAIRFVRSLT